MSKKNMGDLEERAKQVVHLTKYSPMLREFADGIIAAMDCVREIAKMECHTNEPSWKCSCPVHKARDTVSGW